MKKILVIRFSSLGDIVLTGGLFKAIKQENKQIQIVALTKGIFSGILTSNPYIDQVITLDKKTSLFALILQLKKEKFSHVMDLHNNLRSFLIRTLLFLPSTTVNKETSIRHKMLKRKKEKNLNSSPVIQRYFDTAAKAGLLSSKKKPFPFLNIPEEISKKVQSQFISKLGKKPFIVLAPEANWKTKEWPGYEKLIERLLQVHKKNIVIIGTDSKHIQNRKVLNLAGKLTIMESAAVISLSQGVVCNDTGMMHVADALQKPNISIWGPTVRGFGFAPINTKSVILEIANLTCRPCSLHGTETCPQRHFKCMEIITVDDVLEKMNELKIL